MASAATRSLLTAPVTRNMSSSPFTVAVCTIVSQAWNVLAMVICLIFFAFSSYRRGMEANYGKTCSTGSNRAGNIATGNEACVVNELCRSVALITFRH